MDRTAISATGRPRPGIKPPGSGQCVVRAGYGPGLLGSDRSPDGAGSDIGPAGNAPAADLRSPLGFSLGAGLPNPPPARPKAPVSADTWHKAWNPWR